MATLSIKRGRTLMSAWIETRWVTDVINTTSGRTLMSAWIETESSAKQLSSQYVALS